MQINLVEEGEARRVLYSPSPVGKGSAAGVANIGDIGFSGFRVLAPRQEGRIFRTRAVSGREFFSCRGARPRSRRNGEGAVDQDRRPSRRRISSDGTVRFQRLRPWRQFAHRPRSHRFWKQEKREPTASLCGLARRCLSTPTCSRCRVAVDNLGIATMSAHPPLREIAIDPPFSTTRAESEPSWRP